MGSSFHLEEEHGNSWVLVWEEFIHSFLYFIIDAKLIVILIMYVCKTKK